MTKKELATAIYRLDSEKGIKHKCTEKEYVKRALNGIGEMKKGFLKHELEEMYARRC